MRRVLFLICLAALAAVPAASGPSYSIAYWNGGAYVPGPTSSTPLSDSRSYGLAPSGGTGVFTGTAYCGPGYANATGRVDCTWDGGGGFSGRVDVHAATTDLYISGPPGSVVGTLNLRVRLDLTHSGGYPDNNGTYSSFEIGGGTEASATVSNIVSGAHSIYGDGVFSGITSPHVDMLIPLTGTYATNAYYNISLSIYCGGATYGDVNFSPAMSQCAAGGPFDPSGQGIRLEMVNGQVMTLPAGYSLQIPSWGITNNQYTGPAGVADAPDAGGFQLERAGANPTAGDTRMTLVLPRDTRARVVVYDLAGRAIREVLNGWQDAGRHDLAWDGRNDAGGLAAAGIYIVRAESADQRFALRVVRVR